MVCGDIDARTAEQDHYINLVKLPKCLDVPDRQMIYPVTFTYSLGRTVTRSGIPAKTGVQNPFSYAKVRVCPQSIAGQITVAKIAIWLLLVGENKQQHNDEVVEMSKKQSTNFWTVCKTPVRETLAP